MALMGGIKQLILVVLLYVISLSYYCVVEGRGRSISKEEEDHLELDKQLRILNKPPVKTIQTKDGDIFDCINIYEQPAFDHPLLKNHKIQMKPTSSPRILSDETSSSSSSVDQSLNVLKRFDCPEKTVPIRRTSREDLIRAKSFSESFNNGGIRPMLSDEPGQHVTILKSRDNHQFYGVRGTINTATPNVVNDQFSSSQVWIEAGPADDINTIHTGWAVAPSLFGDNKARVFVYWNAKPSKGCFNLLCPGFVQVDKDLTVGTVIDKISEYGGTQFDIDFLLFQDNVTGYWWLRAGKEEKDIGQSGTFVAWGGLVRTGSSGSSSPPMGNGHFPDHDFYKACSVIHMQVVDATNTLVDIKESETEIHTDSTSCYLLEYDGLIKEQGKSFLFGGPGGNQC
ncbi:protein of unknown function DUF239 [Macleaya cordata]|uniref:Neprosin PEP catalytic domain-containing protein n=1 Tax=Macleaya cordata TaxID=56857 RepID=A0A200QPT7_MACCD|nr:protein of unknown function DUF239 [Macleaya cordata]